MYEVLDRIGGGTFGQVFKCNEIDISQRIIIRRVAVKIVKNSPIFLCHALAEAQLLRLLNKMIDPKDEYNIIRMYSYFIFKNHLCMVFELLDDDLNCLLRKCRCNGLPLYFVQQIAAQLVKSLCSLAKGGIVHRDLKPENILIHSIHVSGPPGPNQQLPSVNKTEVDAPHNQPLFQSGDNFEEENDLTHVDDGALKVETVFDEKYDHTDGDNSSDFVTFDEDYSISGISSPREQTNYSDGRAAPDCGASLTSPTYAGWNESLDSAASSSSSFMSYMPVSTPF